MRPSPAATPYLHLAAATASTSAVAARAVTAPALAATTAATRLWLPVGQGLPPPPARLSIAAPTLTPRSRALRLQGATSSVTRIAPRIRQLLDANKPHSQHHRRVFLEPRRGAAAARPRRAAGGARGSAAQRVARAARRTARRPRSSTPAYILCCCGRTVDACRTYDLRSSVRRRSGSTTRSTRGCTKQWRSRRCATAICARGHSAPPTATLRAAGARADG